LEDILKAMKKELIFELSVYAVLLMLVAILWNTPVILTVCYGVMSLVILLVWHTKRDLFFYFVAFILGSLGESIAIYFGAWKYSKPFYLIPLWLPFLWGIAALVVKNISETLLKVGNR
jgi:hypothetical protein